MIFKILKSIGWCALVVIMCLSYPGAALFNLFLRMEQKRVLTNKPKA